MPQRHRPELSESVVADPLVGHRRNPRTFKANRVCAAPDCATRLSIYNSGSFCAPHSAHRVWRPTRLTPVHETPPPDERTDDAEHLASSAAVAS